MDLPYAQHMLSLKIYITIEKSPGNSYFDIILRAFNAIGEKNPGA